MINKYLAAKQKETKAELGRSIHPYTNEDTKLDDESAIKLFENFKYDTGLEDVAKAILHASPSKEENDLRYDLFETAIFYLHSKNNNPDIYVPKVFKNNVEESEIIHPDSVNFIEPEITEDEINLPYQNKSQNKRLQVTSDYHADSVDKLNKEFDEDEYIILSADTANQDFPIEKYTEDFSIFSPLANYTNSKGVSWRTWAETKELGRNIHNWKNGTRF